MPLRIMVRTKDAFDGTYSVELISGDGEVLTRIDGYASDDEAMEAGEQAAAFMAKELGKSIRDE